MIEVEKKFQPTKEKLEKLLSDSEFITRKKINDIYWDFSDYRLLKESTRFRLRNGSFELKIKNKLGGDQEIENEEEIKKYFKTELKLSEFIKKNLVLLMEYKTDRVKYKNGIFEIDIDHMTSEKFKDFVFDMCEIELMVEKESEIKDALLKIEDFAYKYGLEKTKIHKKEACLKAMNQDAYEKVVLNN